MTEKESRERVGLLMEIHRFKSDARGYQEKIRELKRQKKERSISEKQYALAIVAFVYLIFLMSNGVIL